MRTFVFIISFIFTSLSSLAQPLTPYAPNVIFHDMEGYYHDLHAYLDQGKTIVLEFYESDNITSINSRPGIQNLYSSVGGGGIIGNFTHLIFSIDMDSTTATEADFIADYNIEHPVVDSIQNFSSYRAQTNRPMFIVICPDRLWSVRYGSIFDDETYITSMSAQCSPLSDRALDAKIFGYFGDQDYCLGEMMSTFYIQNYSEEDTLFSAKIQVNEANNLRGDTLWTGHLLPYEIDTVNLRLRDISGFDILDFQLDSINASIDNYDNNNSFTRLMTEGKNIRYDLTVKLKTDYYPEQTSWRIIELITGDTVAGSHEHSPYAPNTFYEHTVDFTDYPSGCFQIFVEDAFGDGILTGATPDGPAEGMFLVEADVPQQPILDEIAFERGTSRKFYTLKNIGLTTIEQTELKLDKNPVLNELQLVGELLKDANIKIFNTNGIEILRTSSVDELINLDVSSLKSGLYFVQISNAKQSKTLSFVRL
ncbi:MAG: T9SS type A sorting domain-containing protein [Flavobacteriales bacterium]